jgi:hypothetical protein
LSVARNWNNTGVANCIKNGIYIPTEKLQRLDEFFNFIIKNGEFQVKPYSEIVEFGKEIIMAFCVKYGMYCFPTRELIDFLKNEIGDEKKVIEIGAGRGIISKELNITATDSYQQKQQHIAELYEVLGQAPIQYGDNVERYDAIDAIRKFKPNTVLACWVTHKYNPRQHNREGNAEGVKEEKVLERVRKYIFVGNDKAHKGKPILDVEHRSYKFPWLLARTENQDLNSIWIWRT